MNNADGSSVDKRAGIFSSPDLTVNTENLPSETPGETPKEKPTNTPGHQNSHKRKIFAIFLALLVAIVGIVTVFIMLGNQPASEEHTSKGDISSLQSSLNHYVNLLLYGKTDSDSLADAQYDPFDSKIYTIVYSGNADSINSYFDKAQALLDTFLRQARDMYSSSATPDEEIILSLARNNLSQLQTVREYATMETFNMTEACASQNYSEFQQNVKRYYDNALQSSDSSLREIAEAKMRMSEAITTIFESYKRNDCISNGSIIDSCVEGIVWTDEMLAAQDVFLAAQDNSYQNANNLLSNLFYSCKSLVNALKPVIDNQSEKS